MTRFARLSILVLIGVLVLESAHPMSGLARRSTDAGDTARSAAAAPVADPTGHDLPLAEAGKLGDAALEAGTVVGRASHSRTVANGDGTLSTTHTLRPQHWRDGAGAWREFDNRVESLPDQAAGFALRNVVGPFAARFAPAPAVAAGRPVVELRAGELRIATTALAAAPSAVRHEGATVTYVGAWPGADLVYTLDGERLKEEIVLGAAPAAAPTFAFALELDGLTAREAAGGGLEFVDADGAPRFAMPPLVMSDAADLPAAVDLAFELASDARGRTLITLTPDTAWLADAARVYPVSLDPTVAFLEVLPVEEAGENATILQASQNTNTYGQPSLTVGRNGSGQRSDALIAFPSVTDLPADSVVTHATLELEASAGTDGLGLDVFRIEDEWDDATVTWNNAPAFDSDEVASANAVVGGATGFEITALVNAWLTDTEDNEGVRVRSTGANGESVSIHSAWASCSGCQPTLEITYVPATRYGYNALWTQTSTAYGGGNAAAVEISGGNLAFSHAGGRIDARGFSVNLTHTYNSADPVGTATGNGVGVYGEGWSFAHNLRLFEVDDPAGVVFKDGSGDESRVFVNDGISGGTRSYSAPPHYGYTLTEDTSSPAADKVWTLTADTGGAKHFFDAEGKLTRVEDRNANFLTFAYDGSDRLITITDVAGRATTLEYNGTGGRLSKITDMAGRVSTYAYSAAGDLTTIKHGVGSATEVTTTLGYDDAHRLTSVTNPRGHSAQIRYSAINRWEGSSVEDWEASTADAAISHSTTRAHSGSGSLKADLSNVASTNAVVEKDLNADPAALAATAHELLAWIYLPSGSTGLRARFNLEYVDHLGSPGPWQTLAVGGWTAVRLPGALLEARDQLRELELHLLPTSGAPAFTGSVWIDDVALRGQVASQSDAKPTPNTVVTYAYDPDDTESDVARPNSAGAFQATNYEYTRLGAVNAVTDPLGHIHTYARDELLRVTEITPPGVAAGTYTLAYYPSSMQLQTATNGADEISRRGANTASGDTRYTIDPLNEERRATGSSAFDATILNRDAATGNVLSAAQSNFAAGTDLETANLTSGTEHRQTDFAYTTGGLLDTMTDPLGRVTDFGYDTPKGYLTSIQTPAGSGEATPRTTRFTRNADGSVASMTNAKGQLTTYEYDGLGRLKKINYGVGGGGAFSVTYTLDSNGNLTAMTDAAGSSTFTYDQNNRITAESRTQNATTKTAAYAYFANGTMQTLTTFANQTVSFAYDNALRLASQTDPKNGGGSISFGSDDRDRRSTITYPSGVKHTQTYDPGGRVAQIVLEKADGTDLQKFTYNYGLDGSGNQTANYRGGHVIGVTELSGATVSYGYDAMFRLTSAARTVNNTFNQTYAYDKANNRISFTGGGFTATYDAANQMLTNGSTAYTYDRNGSMTGYTGGNTLTYNTANQWTAASLNGSSYAYTYDGFGRQVSRTQSGVRTDFWFDQTGMTLETGGSSRTYLRDPAGLPLSVLNGTTLSNFGRDRLGSLTGLTSTAQALSGSFVYQPWGAAVGGTGNAADTNLRFAASRRDTGTGWFQMGLRTYNYGFARFTQVDPLPSSITDLNRYAYANCNPTNFIDPTGLIYIDPDHAAILGNPYVQACAGGAVQGAVVSAITGAGIVAGALAGCATDVAITFVSLEVSPELGAIAEYVDYVVDAFEVVNALY